MIFETKYRKQALEQWEASKEEAGRELLEEAARAGTKMISWYTRLRYAAVQLFSSKKSSH